MSDFSSTPSDQPRLLVVARDDNLLEQLQWCLGRDAQLECLDPLAAWSALCGRSFDGALIGSGLEDHMSAMLASAFLRHQPQGRVAVVCSADEPAKIMGMALREERIELFYEPLDLTMLKDCLLLPELPAVLGDFVVPG